MSTIRYQCAARDCWHEWTARADPRGSTACPRCRSSHVFSRPVVAGPSSAEAGGPRVLEGVQATEFIRRGLMRTHFEPLASGVQVTERGTRRRPDGTVEEYERLEFGAGRA